MNLKVLAYDDNGTERYVVINPRTGKPIGGVLSVWTYEVNGTTRAEVTISTTNVEHIEAKKEESNA